jgi:hypothetical protein
MENQKENKGPKSVTPAESAKRARKKGELTEHHRIFKNLMKKPEKLQAEPVQELKVGGLRPSVSFGRLTEPLMFVIKQTRCTKIVLDDDNLTVEVSILKCRIREGEKCFVLYDSGTSRYLIVPHSDRAALIAPRRRKIFELSHNFKGVLVKLLVKDPCVSYESNNSRRMSPAHRDASQQVLAPKQWSEWVAENNSEFVLRSMDTRTVFTVVPQRYNMLDHRSGLQFDLLLYGDSPELPYGVRFTAATTMQLYMYVKERKVWVKKGFREAGEAYGDRAMEKAMTSFVDKHRDSLIAGTYLASERISTAPHFHRSMQFVTMESGVGLNSWGFFQEPYGNHSLLQAVGLAVLGLPSIRSFQNTKEFISLICDEMLSNCNQSYYLFGEERSLQTIFKDSSLSSLLPEDVVGRCFEDFIKQFRAGEKLLDTSMEEMFVKVAACYTNATVMLVSDGVVRPFFPPTPDPELVTYVVQVTTLVWGALVRQDDLESTL